MSRAYDFKNLSPYDFEALCRDLLSKELEVEFEIFPQGRDGGIDLRWLPDDPQELEIIVQCKHYANSSLSALKTMLKSEREKLGWLRPERYILATSRRLTPHNKKEILEILAPYVKTASDIYGRDQLNALLGKFPEIERVNQKLWAVSAEILQRIINSAIFERSRLFLEGAAREALVYVRGASFDRALRKLEKERVLIISGIPGVGKTTLALMLVIDSLRSGYDFVQVSQDVEEAFDVYNDKRQLFLYDDFLGTTSLPGGHLSKNEDDRLLNALRAVRDNPNKRLILTTRDYILAAAQRRYDRLNDPEFSISRFVLRSEGYSKLEKARILFNHVYYSRLTKAQRETLNTEKASEIVSHPNYNPRHIASIAKSAESENSVELGPFFLKYLNQPDKIWGHPFWRHLGEDERLLLYLLATYPYNVSLGGLRAQYIDLLCDENARRRFEDSLSTLDDNFLSLSRGRSEVEVSFFNPSVKSFVEAEVVRKPALLRRALSTSLDFEQSREILSTLRKDAEFYPDPAVIFDTLVKNVFSISNSPFRRWRGLRRSRFRKQGGPVPISSRIRFLLEFCLEHGLEERARELDLRLEQLASDQELLGDEGFRIVETFMEPDRIVINDWKPPCLRRIAAELSKILLAAQPCPYRIAEFQRLTCWMPEFLETAGCLIEHLSGDLQRYFKYPNVGVDSEVAFTAAEAIQALSVELDIELTDDPKKYAGEIAFKEEDRDYEARLDLAYDAQAAYEEEQAELASIENIFNGILGYEDGPL
jgi:conflict system STAND superfamily ATPase/restriction endonuclease